MYARIFYILLVNIIFYLQGFSQEGCSAAPAREKTFTEQFYSGNPHVFVLKGKVKNNSFNIISGVASSIIEVEEIYFGFTKQKEININIGFFPPSKYIPDGIKKLPESQKRKGFYQPGEPETMSLESFSPRGESAVWGTKKLNVDSFYLIYCNDTLATQRYGGLDKPLKNTLAIKNEINLLKQFNEIFTIKKSGNYVFKNEKNTIIAEGEYKYGKPVNTWKHRDAKGGVFMEYNLKENSEKEFNSDGCIKSYIIHCKDSIVYNYYSEKYNYQPSWQDIEIKKDSFRIMKATEYNLNGIKTRKTTQLSVVMKDGKDISGIGYDGLYQEYYLNGKLKLNAQYLKNRRVGCWTWYYEDGNFWAEYDYKEGKNPQ